MRAIEERFGSYVDEHPAIFRFEKWLQIYAGKHPAAFYGLYRLVRKDQARVVTPDTQLVIEGFPRSANTFARVAFNRAQSERVRIAHGLHVPAQVIRAATWRIPTLVLIRKPKDAVLSFAIRDPISVDQALRYYLSFYETVEEYRDAYVLGTLRRGHRRLRRGHPAHKRQVRNDLLTVQSRRTERRRCVRPHREKLKEEVRGDILGEQGLSSLRLQREAQARNGIRTGEPET